MYRLRLIAENLFGKDVSLPRPSSATTCRRKVGERSAALQGRDQTYLLPPQSVRVMSLVPADATDIRDTPGETFGDLDQRAFRANLFTIIGGVLFALAGLMALLALVRARAALPQDRDRGGERLMTDGAVLRGVGRELAAVRRERDGSGWSPELAGRALAALRIAGTLSARASGQPAAGEQLSAEGEDVPEAGTLILRAGWPRAQTDRGLRRGDLAVDRRASSRAARANARRAALLESLGRAL